MNRRQFLESAAVAAGAAAFLPLNTALAAEPAKGVNWPIGCFERPWFEGKSPWSYDTALDGIKAAGYKLMGMLTEFRQGGAASSGRAPRPSTSRV